MPNLLPLEIQNIASGFAESETIIAVESQKRQIHCHDHFVAACEELGVPASVNPLQAAVVVALCILDGPDRNPIEPELVQQLALLLRASLGAPGSDEATAWRRADELAVGLLMGWRPTLEEGQPAISADDIEKAKHPWGQKALEALRVYIVGQVDRVLDQMSGWHRGVLGFGAWRREHPEAEQEWIESLVTRILATGTLTCDCWRVVKGTGEAEPKGNAKRAITTCGKNHRLAAFNPNESLGRGNPNGAEEDPTGGRMTLWQFVSRAVLGDPYSRFRNGSFPNGMLFYLAHRDAGLEVASRLARFHCVLCDSWRSRPCSDKRLEKLNLARHSDSRIGRQILTQCGLREGRPLCALQRQWLYLPGSGFFRETSFYECQHQKCLVPETATESHYFEATLHRVPLLGFRSELNDSDLSGTMTALARHLRTDKRAVTTYIVGGEPLGQKIRDWEGTRNPQSDLKRIILSRFNEVIRGHADAAAGPAPAAEGQAATQLDAPPAPAVIHRLDLEAKLELRGVTLSPDASDLLARPEGSLSPVEVALLNRWILAACYPALIPPPKPREFRCTVNESDVLWERANLAGLVAVVHAMRALLPGQSWGDIAEQLSRHIQSGGGDPSTTLKDSVVEQLNGLMRDRNFIETALAYLPSTGRDLGQIDELAGREKPSKEESLLLGRLVLEAVFVVQIRPLIICPRCKRRSTKEVNKPFQGIIYSPNPFQGLAAVPNNQPETEPQTEPEPAPVWFSWADVDPGVRRDFFNLYLEASHLHLVARIFCGVLAEGPNRIRTPEVAVRQIQDLMKASAGATTAMSLDEISNLCEGLERRLEKSAKSFEGNTNDADDPIGNA